MVLRSLRHEKTIEQLDRLTLGKDAALDHPVILFNRQRHDRLAILNKFPQGCREP